MKKQSMYSHIHTEHALGDSRKENLPFNRRTLHQKKAKGGTAICYDRLMLRGERLIITNDYMYSSV